MNAVPCVNGRRVRTGRGTTLTTSLFCKIIGRKNIGLAVVMFLSSGESIILGTVSVRDRQAVNECLKPVSISYSLYMLRTVVTACVL